MNGVRDGVGNSASQTKPDRSVVTRDPRDCHVSTLSCRTSTSSAASSSGRCYYSFRSPRLSETSPGPREYRFCHVTLYAINSPSATAASVDCV